MLLSFSSSAAAAANSSQNLTIKGVGTYTFERSSEKKRVVKALKAGLKLGEALSCWDPAVYDELVTKKVKHKTKGGVKDKKYNLRAESLEEDYDDLTFLDHMKVVQYLDNYEEKYQYISKLKSRKTRWMLRWYLVKYEDINPKVSEWELLSDWAAFNDVRRYLLRKNICGSYSIAKDLLWMGVRFAWQAEATVELWNACYSSNTTWNRGRLDKVVAVACCRDIRKMSLKLKKAIVKSHFFFHKERLGSYNELKKAARVWVVAPRLPKKLALKVFKLQDTMKFRLAQVAYSPYISEEEFWVKYNRLLKLQDRRVRAIALYNGGYERLAINLMHQGASELSKVALYEFYKSQDDIRFINIKVKALNAILEKNNEWSHWMAIPLGYTFGNNWKQWLEKNNKTNRSDHDAVYYLPKGGDVKGLDSFLLKNANKPINELELVCLSWGTLSLEDKELKFKDLILKLQAAKYPKVKCAAFSEESIKHGVDKKDYHVLEERFIKAQALEDFHPEVKIEKEGYKGKFLRRSDVRGIYLGQYTNCCQHPLGVGKTCAWYGLENPNSGFFVVKDQNEEIIAQSWVWSTPEGLCFDNVEAKGLGSRDKLVGSIYKEAANELLKTHKWITMGLGLGDLQCVQDISIKEMDCTLSLPNSYSGYTDARSQVVLGYNPKSLGIIMPEVRVAGITSLDKEGMDSVANAVYTNEWQFAGSEETDFGLKLLKGDTLIGYATIETINHYISDIAVLEEHRKYSKLLIDRVLKYCRTIGGEWRADCRVSTSYRLLKAYERRGRLNILEDCESSQKMDNLSMRLVKFEVI